MQNFERIVMISPVGLEKDRVLAGFKKFGVTNLYLIRSVKKIGSEKRLADTVRTFAEELENYFEKIMDDLYLKDVNITDFQDCLKLLKKIVKEEILKSIVKIYINISTSSKVFAIAAIYIAGLYPELIVPFYVRTSNYLFQDIIDILNDKENLKNSEKTIKKLLDKKQEFEDKGWTKGEFEINLIPALPLKKFTEFQKTIFIELLEKQNECKLKDIIASLKRDNIKVSSFRTKLSYALRDLINYGLLNKKKKGNEVYLVLTESGIIFGSFLI